jgi:hypothetical protein
MQKMKSLSVHGKICSTKLASTPEGVGRRLVKNWLDVQLDFIDAGLVDLEQGILPFNRSRRRYVM